jgi:hypothetical protein
MTNQPKRTGTTNVSVEGANLEPAELLRLARLGRELRLTDQILSLDLDTLSIVDKGPAPAWTTLEGDHISFAMDKMPLPKGAIDVAVWLGTNAHELGHVLFSPRRWSPLMQRVIEGDKVYMPGLAQLHNILEDQRQERLILGRFAPWRAYLIAALGHHIVANDDSAWLLLCGRTWLPEEIRQQSKARFVIAYNETVADEVALIVGDYQRLTDPGDIESDDAWELLTRLHNLLPSMPRLPGTGCQVMEGGEPDTDPQSGEGIPQTADEADEEGESGEGDQEGNGQDGETDSPSKGSGNDQGEGDESSSDQTGQGTSGGNDPPPKVTPKDMRRSLTNAAGKQLESDKEAKDDLDKVFDALRNGSAGGDIDGDFAEGEYIEATDQARMLHHEVGDALLELKDASEPGWVKRTDSGRLKVSRLINPNIDQDEWFDRYDPGQLDASQMEVVVLLDVSGSMLGSTFALSEATWAIRQAVDDLEGSCAVLTYSSGEPRVMARPGDRPDGRMFKLEAWGSTEPKLALDEAHRLLANSQARNRLLVILTDGRWHERYDRPGRNDQMIDAINSAGVITTIALLGSVAGTDLHHCRYGATIDDPLELARLFRRVATDQIGRW